MLSKPNPPSYIASCIKNPKTKFLLHFYNIDPLQQDGRFVFAKMFLSTVAFIFLAPIFQECSGLD